MLLSRARGIDRAALSLVKVPRRRESWVILNREADYIADLRTAQRVPVFCITSDHRAIGHIQGQQIAAMVPQGGAVLYVQGPSGKRRSPATTEGMQHAKPASIQVRMLRAQWTEGSAYQAVSAWLRLSTSRALQMDAVFAQDDLMAMGARKAFQEIADSKQREHWVSLPFAGCDGMSKTGQAAQRLAGSYRDRSSEHRACARDVGQNRSIRSAPPERTFTDVRSFLRLRIWHPPKKGIRLVLSCFVSSTTLAFVSRQFGRGFLFAACRGRSVDFHSISATILGAVEGLVGKLDHSFDAGMFRIGLGHPNTHSY